MIIRSVRAEGFGCFAAGVEVGRFSDGVNLMFAPNGTGKSTLVRALRMALMDGHRVRAAEVKNWRTWGRSLAPRVTVDLEHGGAEYRLEKGFLDGAFSKLSRREAGVWRPLMAGDDADEFVRKDVLACTPPGAGLAQAKNWGLAQVLWTSQGDLALPPLADNVVAAVRQSVGSTLTGSSSAVEARIRELHTSYFTPTGRVKRGSKEAPLAAWQRRRDELSVRDRMLEEELTTFDQTSAQIVALRTAVENARALAATYADQREREAERAELYKSLLTERDRQEERHKAAQAVCSEMKNRISGIAGSRKLLHELTADLARLQQESPVLEKRWHELAKDAEEAEHAVEKARSEEQTAREAAIATQLAREYLQARQQMADLGSRLAKAADIDAEIERMKAELDAITAPSAADVARLRKLTAEARSASERLAMARVNAAIEPSVGGSIRVLEGEQIGAVAITAGSAVSIGGSPNLTFEIPGFGRVRVTGPAADYNTIRRELEKTESELREYDIRLGCHDPEHLDVVRNRHVELAARLSGKQAERSGVLGSETSDVLAARAACVAARVAEIEVQNPEWQNDFPDADALERSSSDRTAAAVQTRIDAETRQKIASAAAAAAHMAFHATGLSIAGTQKQLDDTTRDLEVRIADGRTDEDRAAALDKALLDYDAAASRLKDATRQLAEFAGDPAQKIALLDRQIRDASLQVESLRDQLVRAETQTEALAAKSPYDALNQVREESAVLAEQIEREQLRMDAIALLHETIADVRAEMLGEVAGPVQEAATLLLSELCERDFARIQLTPALSPDQVIPAVLAGFNELVDADRLSGGEKEQVYFCTRLAIAKQMAQAERQLVILDDVLTFTDSARLARICEVLSRESARLQILLLTCHPERFYGIRDAALFDLQALLESAAVADSAGAYGG